MENTDTQLTQTEFISDSLTNTLSLPGMTLTPAGARIEPGATFAQIKNAAHLCERTEVGLVYYKADLFDYARAMSPEFGMEVGSIFGFDYSSARKARAIARVALELRRPELSPEHHWCVGRHERLTPEQQQEWLAAAVEHQLSPGELHRSILQGQVTKRQKRLSGLKSPTVVRTDYLSWRSALPNGDWHNLSHDTLRGVIKDLTFIVEEVAAMQEFVRTQMEADLDDETIDAEFEEVEP